MRIQDLKALHQKHSLSEVLVVQEGDHYVLEVFSDSAGKIRATKTRKNERGVVKVYSQLMSAIRDAARIGFTDVQIKLNDQEHLH